MKRQILRFGALALGLLVLLVLLVACSPGAPATTPTPGAATQAPNPTTAQPAPSAAAQPTSQPPTAAPAPTAPSIPTTAPSAEPQASPPPATAAPPVPTVPIGGTPGTYLDDRSTGVSVIMSYYNAINRKEYARAYSYWSAPSGSPNGPPAYPQFEQGYADTQSVQLTIGTVSSGVGAGQLYYSVPVSLTASMTSGGAQSFVGCYTLHLGSPQSQAVPPFQPLAIESASVQQVSGAPTAGQLASACPADAGQPIPPTAVVDPNDISPARYIDDRSSPEQVLRSYYNAVNSKEYVRAYSYWSAPSGSPNGPPAYPQFEQGYADTQSVQLTIGTVTGNPGAGQLYYDAPVTIVAKTTDGATQTFVGCYTLHLSQPAIQAAPPFHPMGIEAANIKQVANDANTAELMGQGCQ